MIDLIVKDLVKSFDTEENILDGLSFDVQAGERVGIMGRNGAGKTTLFRILTGEIGFDSGEVTFAPGKKVGLISQIPNYPADYSVEDVLRTAFAGLEKLKTQLAQLEQQMGTQPGREILTQYDTLMDRFTTGGGYEMEVDLQKVVNGLNIPPDMRQRQFSMLSGGEKTRVNLARLLLEKTDILLLDEPTNHLDMKSVEWLEEYILKFKGTVLTISHDRYFLDRIVQRIVELRGGKAEFYTGNYSAYVIEKQARFDLQMKQYEQEQAKLKQLGYTVERMKGWGINNRTLYRRAMSIQHRMERIEKTERPVEEKKLKLRFSEKDFLGDELFTVHDLGKSFGDKVLFDHVDLEVKGGERIALLGDNGTGKSTFLKILLGEMTADHGKIKFGPTVKTAYLPQIIHFAHPERTLYDTMLYEKNCTPRRHGIGWAPSYSRATRCLKLSPRSPAASRAVCGCACSWTRKSIFSSSTSPPTTWTSPLGNGSRLRWKTMRAHCSSCPTTATSSTASPPASGFWRTAPFGTIAAAMRNTAPSWLTRPKSPRPRQ